MGGQNIPANNEQNDENMGLMPLLPPGFRFLPSDEEIFRYYLVNKNDRQNPNPGQPFQSQHDQGARRVWLQPLGAVRESLLRVWLWGGDKALVLLHGSSWAC
ncbi:hypothetical protein NL676_025870 [Syzygium grande]|nr:hypothetical protein NL676_025870 [Syzygium grande]